MIKPFRSIRRVAIVGLGRMGERHIQAAQRVGLEIVGLCDVDETRCSELVKSYSLWECAISQDLSRLLAQCAPDALVIATTADNHFHACSTGLSLDVRYILCEKPFVVSLKEGFNLERHAAEVGAEIFVNHQGRFTNRYTVLSGLLASQMFGNLLSVAITSGNIGLAMGVSHQIDLFQLLTASNPTYVEFEADDLGDPNPRGSQFSDPSGYLTLINSSNQRMTVHASARSGHGLVLTAVCEFGQIAIDQLTGNVSVQFRTTSSRSLPTTRYSTEAVHGTFKLPPDDAVTTTANVWKAILTGGQPMDATEALSIVRTLAAAELSAKSGGERISLDDPHLDTLSFPWP